MPASMFKYGSAQKVLRISECYDELSCLKREKVVREEVRTDFDGSDAKAAGLKHDADAAGGDAFAEAAYYSSGDQNVLHSVIWGMGKT